MNVSAATNAAIVEAEEALHTNDELTEMLTRILARARREGLSLTGEAAENLIQVLVTNEQTAVMVARFLSESDHTPGEIKRDLRNGLAHWDAIQEDKQVRLGALPAAMELLPPRSPFYDQGRDTTGWVIRYDKQNGWLLASYNQYSAARLEHIDPEEVGEFYVPPTAQLYPNGLPGEFEGELPES